MAVDSKRKTAAGDFSPFHDLTKTLESFKVPGIDLSAFVKARRSDVEALTAANKAAYDALQALGQTQAEMLIHSMKDMQKTANGLSHEGAQGKQADAARLAWQRMLADIKELAELARKSQTQAMVGMTRTA